jgi:mRNA interferase MazF
MYIPERGDVIWMDFDPQVGHEQAGRRPALVLSPAAYNGPTGLAVVCPITSRVKGFRFEVLIPSVTPPLHGVILADQVNSNDWRGRNATFIVRLPAETVDRVLARIATLLGFDL